jgi:hypothetical protein
MVKRENDLPTCLVPVKACKGAAESTDGRIRLVLLELLYSPLKKQSLRRMREASSAESRQTNAMEVLIELASEVGLDVAKFVERMGDGSAEAAFERDRELCARLNVHGFPTFLVEHGEKAVLLRGWQQYETIKAVMQQLTGGAMVEREVERSDASILAFIRARGNLAPAEIAAAFDLSREAAEAVLGRLEGQGEIARRKVGNGSFVRARAAQACDATRGVCAT